MQNPYWEIRDGSDVRTKLMCVYVCDGRQHLGVTIVTLFKTRSVNIKAEYRDVGRGGGQEARGMFHRWYLLQFSSSLPSGQSLKPLQRKRPMMQWTPLAQAKNVGAHFDLNLAGERRRAG